MRAWGLLAILFVVLLVAGCHRGNLLGGSGGLGGEAKPLEIRLDVLHPNGPPVRQ